MTKGKQNWEFAARLAVSTVVLGSVFSLGAVSVTTVRSILDRKEAVAADNPVKLELDNYDVYTPIEKKISDHEAALARLKDEANIQEEKLKLGSLYWQSGKRSQALGQFPRSEQAFQSALSYDPENAQYMADLAGLYADNARRQHNSSMRVTLYQSSRQFYRRAWRSANQEQKAQSYNYNASVATLSLAKELRATGRLQEANDTLREAVTWATPEFKKEITDLLSHN